MCKQSYRSVSSAWLYRIATNVGYDALRRRRIVAWRPLEELVVEPAGGASDDPQTFYAGSVELKRQALASIPESYRRALLLVEEGYSREQIAQALGITPKGVKMYLSRARRRLRDQYQALEQEVAHE